MKPTTPMFVLVCGLGLAGVARAADTDGGHGTKSTNAATSATPNGAGQAATPAMPGNPTAQDKVTANRKKMLANRERAAQLRDAAQANGDHGQLNRPDNTHPVVVHPEVQRPVMNH